MKKIFTLTIYTLLLTTIFSSCGFLSIDTFDSQESQSENNVVISDAEAENLLVTDMNYINWYANKCGANLYGWDKYINLLNDLKKIMEVSNKNTLIYLSKDGGLFSENSFTITTDDTSDYIYVGELKDNKPHGVGSIFNRDGYCYYMGNFKDGFYSGFGLEYYIPNATDEAYLTEIYGYDALETHKDRINYCIYIGNFKENKYSGKGNEFTIPAVDYDLATGELTAARDILITIAEYTDGEVDGDFEVYTAKYLLAEGELNRGTFSDKGNATVYYPASTKIKYKGEINDSNYHGKGTLYDEEGNEIYSGEWKNGDYAS